MRGGLEECSPPKSPFNCTFPSSCATRRAEQRTYGLSRQPAPEGSSLPHFHTMLPRSAAHFRGLVPCCRARWRTSAVSCHAAEPGSALPRLRTMPSVAPLSRTVHNRISMPYSIIRGTEMRKCAVRAPQTHALPHAHATWRRKAAHNSDLLPRDLQNGTGMRKCATAQPAAVPNGALARFRAMPLCPAAHLRAFAPFSKLHGTGMRKCAGWGAQTRALPPRNAILRRKAMHNRDSLPRDSQNGTRLRKCTISRRESMYFRKLVPRMAAIPGTSAFLCREIGNMA